MVKYIIGTGWWCDGTGKHSGSIQSHIKSSDEIRKKEFFNLWYYFVNKYTNPEKIIIIDSNSPIKPDLPDDSRIEFLRLRKNFGHVIDALKRKLLCGASRAVLSGGFYSYLNDADYFIYIEQDCLVKGKGWVEKCIKEMKKGKIMYGDGECTPQPQQMSLMIIKNEFILEFILRFLEDWNKIVDHLVEGEDVSNYSPEKRLHRLFKNDADFLPFGYGRARPINFDDEYVYAQYWRKEELEKFLNMEK